MAKLCPICREDNLSNARFCSSCGSVIAHVEASFSGFGASHAGAKGVDNAIDKNGGTSDQANSRLAAHLVDLATSQALQGSRPTNWSRRILSNLYAVTSLACATIVLLLFSLVWIVKGHRIATGSAAVKAVVPSGPAETRQLIIPEQVNNSGRAPPEVPPAR